MWCLAITPASQPDNSLAGCVRTSNRKSVQDVKIGATCTNILLMRFSKGARIGLPLDQEIEMDGWTETNETTESRWELIKRNDAMRLEELEAHRLAEAIAPQLVGQLLYTMYEHGWTAEEILRREG